MKSFLQNLDMNGVTFHLTYKSETSFKTAFGGSLTILYFIIIIIIILFNYFNLKNQSISGIMSYTTHVQEKSILNNDNFFIGIGFKTDSETINSSDYITLDAKHINTQNSSFKEISFKPCTGIQKENFLCLNLNNISFGGELLNFKKHYISFEYSFNYAKFLKDSNFEEKLVEVFLYFPIKIFNNNEKFPYSTNYASYKIKDFHKYDVNINKFIIQENKLSYDTYSVSDVTEIRGFRKGEINLHLNNLMTVYSLNFYTLNQALYNIITLSGILFLIINFFGKAYNSKQLKEEFINETFQIIDNKEVDSEGIKIDVEGKKIEECELNDYDNDNLKSESNIRISSMSFEKKSDVFTMKRYSKKLIDLSLKLRIIYEALCCKKSTIKIYNDKEKVKNILENAYNSYTDAKNIVKRVDQFEYLKYLNMNPYQIHMLNMSKVNLNIKYDNFDHFNNDEGYIKEFFMNNLTENNTKTEKSLEYIREKLFNNNLSEMDKFVLKRCNNYQLN